ncbi:hypothetical protein BDBG_02501 [Blastomyces gilchristii SLH14081]|uniref:J domain-containing protein n=1 Tax=Blastomyces gilchristii (strain SLH14081) TaxID=559298 RepID=A0A179UGW2_BLAGS|nr:uncharacterized protein BDBG_02501 [Blastomyces gilchristii SLH14081]OAT06251.1 hypothetical protein BDBG_02501 [Blastomyces gilchristii SLH14081]
MTEPTEIDCYRILKVSKGASLSDIKKAYRKRLLETHPDKNPGIESSLFVKVQSAWETLSDASKRYCFDCKYERIKQEWDKYEEACGRQRKTTTGAGRQGTGDKLFTEADVHEILEKLRRAEAALKREGEEKRAREKRQEEEKRRREEERREEEERKRKEQFPKSRNAFDFSAMEDALDDLDDGWSGGRGWSGTARQPPNLPREEWNGNDSHCHHNRWWPYVYGAGSCDYCDRYCPIYLLGCPSCDALACVPCKIRVTGS